MKLVDALVSELQDIGCSELFGIPGDFVLPLLQGLQQNGQLPFYSLHHEPSVVYAADACARFARRPSAVVLTYGAGALNAVNAIAQAYVERVPLVIISGFPDKQEIDRNIAIHHQAKNLDSQRSILAEVTAVQVRIDNAETALKDLRYALRSCQRESRPVLVEIPRSAPNLEIAESSFGKLIRRGKNAPRNSTKLITLIAGRLQSAKRPMLLAGIEVQRYGATEALQNLAQQLNIPIVTTFLARAAVSHSHPCVLGTFVDDTDQLPYHLLQNSDLIIHFGVIVNDSNFAAYPQFARGTKVIQLHQNITVLDDMAFANTDLASCCEQLLVSNLHPFSTWWSKTPITALIENETWNASTIVEEIDAALVKQSEIVPIISDVGDCLFASLHTKATHVLAPAYYASMGYGVPAALGVYVSSRLRSVVLVGDGAFMMTGLEISQLKAHGAKPIIVIFNNKSWDMIEAFSPGLSCAGRPECDLQQLTTALGAQSYQVTTIVTFNQAFQQAWQDTTSIHVIEVLLTNHRSRRLESFAQRFVQGCSL